MYLNPNPDGPCCSIYHWPAVLPAVKEFLFWWFSCLYCADSEELVLIQIRPEPHNSSNFIARFLHARPSTCTWTWKYKND